MNLIEIVKIAVSKFKRNEKTKKFLEERVKKAPEISAKEFFNSLEEYVKINALDNEVYASLLEKLIKTYQLQLVNDDYKKELKHLVSSPPLKVYLQGLVF